MTTTTASALVHTNPLTLTFTLVSVIFDAYIDTAYNSYRLGKATKRLLVQFGDTPWCGINTWFDGSLIKRLISRKPANEQNISTTQQDDLSTTDAVVTQPEVPLSPLPTTTPLHTPLVSDEPSVLVPSIPVDTANDEPFVLDEDEVIPYLISCVALDPKQWTTKQLRDTAKELGMSKLTRLNKGELIHLLTS